MWKSFRANIGNVIVAEMESEDLQEKAGAVSRVWHILTRAETDRDWSRLKSGLHDVSAGHFSYFVVHVFSCKKVWEMFVKGGTLGDTDSQELWPSLLNNNTFSWIGQVSTNVIALWGSCNGNLEVGFFSFLREKFIWNIWTRIKWEGNLSEIFGRG